MLAQQPQTNAPATAAEVLGNGTTPNTPQTQNQAPQDKLTPKFQALLQRERSAVNLEKAAKTQQEALAQRIKELEERELKVKEFYEIKDKYPTKALELLGLSYQDLTKIMLEEGNIPADVEVKKVRGELESFKKDQELYREEQEIQAKERAEREEKQKIQEFQGAIKEYLNENPGRYELISFEYPEGPEDIIYRVIDGHYERTINQETGLGEILTIPQAADKVEDHLEKKYQKAPTLKKLQAFLVQRQVEPATKQKTPESQKPTTLTNQHSATPTPTRSGPITDEERIRRAVAYAQSLKR